MSLNFFLSRPFGPWMFIMNKEPLIKSRCITVLLHLMFFKDYMDIRKWILHPITARKPVRSTGLAFRWFSKISYNILSKTSSHKDAYNLKESEISRFYKVNSPSNQEIRIHPNCCFLYYVLSFFHNRDYCHNCFHYANT